MPIVPVRDVAKGGVITDVDPYQLPLGAWSWGANVRFRNNQITRAPVFRTVTASPSFASPRFLGNLTPVSGADIPLLGYLNGRVTKYVSGVETDLSVTGFVNSSVEATWTECNCAEVKYVNRSDRAPWKLGTADSIFVTLPNWAPVSSPWTANILRASNSALCAFGVTQNGTFNPNMVITSEFATAGNVPSSWDYTLGNNNATQNNLAEMKGPITDAQNLGNVVYVYGQNETWLMTLSGDDNIWDYFPIFNDRGAISANCAVEVNKKHYVFGLDDIWMHDGNSWASICDERVREFIFSNLDTTKTNRCAVVYNPLLQELCFRYASFDQYAAFTGADGANRQAVFHIPTNTWSFDDLPFVFGAAMTNVVQTPTWTSVGGTWDTIGGSWGSLDGGAKDVLCMFGDSNSGLSLSESLYAFDLQGPGSIVSYTVDTHATKGWTLIRDGIDLDQLGVDLRGYKVISSIYPRMRLENSAVPVQFTISTSDFYGQTANDPIGPQTYDGDTLYKLDFNAAGRYLSMTITHPDYHWITFTGLDADIDVLGEF